MALGGLSTCGHCQRQTMRQTAWAVWVCGHCQHLNDGDVVRPVPEPEEDLCLPWVGMSLTLHGTTYAVVGRWQLLCEESYRNLWMLAAGDKAQWLLEWNGRLVLLTEGRQITGTFSTGVSGPQEKHLTRYSADDFFAYAAEGELSIRELAPEGYYLYQGVKKKVFLVDTYEGFWIEYAGHFIDLALLDPAIFRIGKNTPLEWQLPKEPEQVTCPSCHHQFPVYTFTQAISMVCPKCGLSSGWKNATGNELELHSRQLKGKNPKTILLPIGKQFQLRGVDYRLVGYVQQRERHTVNTWREYVLFSQSRGFAYLSEYDGHWNLFTELDGRPDYLRGGAVVHADISYRQIATYGNVPDYAVGEFPYLVTESTDYVDFVSPPYTLAASKGGGYLNWMHGEYISIKEIRAFVMPGASKPVGVAPAEPTQLFMPIRTATIISLVAAALLLALQTTLVTLYPEKKLANEYVTPPTGAYFAERPGPVVTVPDGPLGLTGLDVVLNAPVDNAWLAVAVTFVNRETGAEHLVDVEVGYYYGMDRDATWSEGSTVNDEVVTALPAGTYDTVLKVYEGSQVVPSYRVEMVSSKPYWSNVMIALVFLAAVPLFLIFKESYMEAQRYPSD